MKIILSAYGCHPNRGSEAGVGWNWLVELSKYNKVWVLFYKGQGQYEAVSTAIKNLPTKENIHLVPIDVPFPFGIKKLFRFRYEIWQIKAFFAAKKIIKKEKIDLIHQVTIAAWWFTGYYFLIKKPLIWGPISGGQTIPLKAYYFLRKKDIFYEILRNSLIKVFMQFSFSFRKNIRSAKIIFSANEATTQSITKINKAIKCLPLTEIGVDKIYLNNEILPKNNKEKLNILWSGNLLALKNFGLLLQSLQKLPDIMNWELRVAGDGKMLNYWQKKVLNTKINNRIKFLGKIDYSKMNELYNWADIFVFPSLREASGTVILEAMSHGVPVIAMNLNGAKNIIDKTCGILIDVITPQQMVNDFTSAIIKLYENPQLRIEMGNKAHKKVEENFLWEKRGKLMNQIYLKIIDRIK